MMRRAQTVLAPDGEGAHRVADVVTLDHERRYCRRRKITADGGTVFLIDLASTLTLRDGDRLLLDDGGVVVVRAATEPLLEVKEQDAANLARIAWHLGNRHLPVQVVPGGLRLRGDRVIEAMLRGLGAHVHLIAAAFDPEGGAYAGGHAHEHHDGTQAPALGSHA